MSSKVTITYKRKHVTSHTHRADDTVVDSSSAASRNVVVSNLPPKFGAHAENTVINEDNFHTLTKQQNLYMPMQQKIKEECEAEKGHNQLCKSLPRKEQSEICRTTIPSTAEAHSNKFQCTSDTSNPVPVSSSLCDSMHANGMTNREKDSNTSAPEEKKSHQGPENAVTPGQCMNRFSPLLTFRRRVKKKVSLDEPAEKHFSPDNEKQSSTLTCSPPIATLNAASLLKYSGGGSLDIEDKATTVKESTGLSIQVEHSLEQKSSHIAKSSVLHIVPLEAAEVVNQNMTLENDGTPVSKFSGIQEVTEQYARVEDSSKTSPVTTEVPKVINVQKEGHSNGQTSSLESPIQNVNVSWLKATDKFAAEDLLESQGSTKNVPIIVLDDDINDRGKEQENLEAFCQGLHNKNKTICVGGIDLNCAELRQEEFLHLDDSPIQRLPDQELVGNTQKQMSQPIERMFFTKEKDIIYGKQPQHEESSSMHASYSNFFDLTPPWNTGSLKGPRNLPSELKFRIMDKVPEFSLNLSLDSFAGNSVSAWRTDKLLLGGTSNGSHKLKEKLSTYSYKRHSALWSEEELDFLWIGVRRYGINNWNAMIRDTRLRFSNSRMPEDLAKQWDKEQKKLLASALAPAPPLPIAEEYFGRASCSGCSNSPFASAQTNLSLGDVYLCNARASERTQHHLSGLNLHGIDGGPRNLSLGDFPVACSSSHGRSGSRRRRSSKLLHKSYYDNNKTTGWFQQQPERLPQLPHINREAINSLPQWLIKDRETGTSRIDQMWPSMGMAPPLPLPGHHRHSAAGAGPPAPRDNNLIRAASASLFSDDVKPHAVADASLERTMRRNTDWRSFSKRLFRTGDALDLNQGASAMAAPNTSDPGASSEETVSDS